MKNIILEADDMLYMVKLRLIRAKRFIRLFFAVFTSSIGKTCTIDGVKVTSLRYSYWLAKGISNRI